MEHDEQEDTTWDPENPEDVAEWERMHGIKTEPEEVDRHTCGLQRSGGEASWACGACEAEART